jgi:hypothetical protein
MATKTVDHVPETATELAEVYRVGLGDRDERFVYLTLYRDGADYYLAVSHSVYDSEYDKIRLFSAERARRWWNYQRKHCYRYEDFPDGIDQGRLVFVPSGSYNFDKATANAGE